MAPAQLLRKGNSDLARDGIYTWSIPALVASSTVTGGVVNTCPQAGACASLCYARQGRYRFGTVLASHTRNLNTYLADPQAWIERMASELQARRFRPTGVPHSPPWPVRDGFQWWQESGARSVRIHDAGDFFSRPYLEHWALVAESAPDVLFYAYSKEVALVKLLGALGLLPPNLVVVFSLGGKQDQLVDRGADRHCDVFPTLEALEAAGYTDQADSDLMAPLHPNHRVGIVANRLPALRKHQGKRSFSELQVAMKKPPE